jgi:hypothetical protein
MKSLLLTGLLTLSVFFFSPSPTLAESVGQYAPQSGSINYVTRKNEFYSFTVDNFLQDLRDKRPFAVISVFDSDPIWLEQEPALYVLMQNPDFVDLRVYKINLTAQIEDAQKVDLAEPGLLTVYRDGKQIHRVRRAADTEKIADYFAEALGLDPVQRRARRQ